MRLLPAALTAAALALFSALPAHAIDMKIVTVSSTGEVMQGVMQPVARASSIAFV